MNRSEFLTKINADTETLARREEAEHALLRNDTLLDLLDRVCDYEASHPGAVQLSVLINQVRYYGKNPEYVGSTLALSVEESIVFVDVMCINSIVVSLNDTQDE